MMALMQKRSTEHAQREPETTGAPTQECTTSPAVGVAWDLSDLFTGPDDPRIRIELDAMDRDAEAFAARFRGTIDVAGGPRPEWLFEGVESLEALIERQWRIGGFAHLNYDQDTRDETARAFSQRVEERLTAPRNALLFFDLEWMAVGDDDAARLLGNPRLHRYRHFLEAKRLFRPHRLSEAEERLANEKDVTGSSAWARLHTETTSALEVHVQHDGKEQVLNLSRALALLHDRDREVRRSAHDGLYSALAKAGPVLTFAYDTLIQDKRTMDRLRGHADPMASRHLGNEVPASAVETMMRAVESAYPVAQAWFRTKAGLLKVPELMIYDQYAPLDRREQSVPWADARRLVEDSYEAIDPGFGAIAREVFGRRWIDAEPRDGKRGGAYCSYPSPTLHPWILCNYVGTPRDVMTVAHEMGHAIHAMASRVQTPFNYHSTLPLAETASVFGEMVVFDRLLTNETDPSARLGLLAGKIEDAFATVFRQNVLTRFEQAAFAARADGRLTATRLGDLWIEANRAYYGDAVHLTEGYRWGWSYIPHFIQTPFYCYAYVFGQLLVMALYRMFKEQGQAFVPRFATLLAAGGSHRPDDLLRPLGVDLYDETFWAKGIDEVRNLVAEATSLAASEMR
jgi:oligoendopeptidase F